jgi:hypothetical protein
LCRLHKRWSRLQHTRGRGCDLLHDWLVVGEDAPRFLGVWPHRLVHDCSRLAARLGLLTRLFGTLQVLFRRL